MKNLTDSWQEAVAFFGEVVGLHDSLIEDVQIEEKQKRCVLVLGQVSRHSIESGFTTAYLHLHVEMLGCSVGDAESMAKYRGYDVVDAELLPGSLWIKSMVGSISFQFNSIRFNLPETDC